MEHPAEAGYVGGLWQRRHSLLVGEIANSLVNLVAVNANVGRGGDSEPHPLALDGHHGDSDPAIDYDLLAFLAGEYEHGFRP